MHEWSQFETSWNGVGLWKYPTQTSCYTVGMSLSTWLWNPPPHSLEGNLGSSAWVSLAKSISQLQTLLPTRRPHLPSLGIRSPYFLQRPPLPSPIDISSYKSPTGQSGLGIYFAEVWATHKMTLNRLLLLTLHLASEGTDFPLRKSHSRKDNFNL